MKLLELEERAKQRALNLKEEEERTKQKALNLKEEEERTKQNAISLKEEEQRTKEQELRKQIVDRLRQLELGFQIAENRRHGENVPQGYASFGSSVRTEKDAATTAGQICKSRKEDATHSASKQPNRLHILERALSWLKARISRPKQ